jgi:ribosomal protein L37AE/L43A
MKLNKKNQCPVCKVKPLTYKRDGLYFCHRCDRAFSLESKKWIPNWAWGNPKIRK